MGEQVKSTLTPAQRSWLERHFKHTANREIAAKLGFSEATLHRLARAMGLRKSPQFMRRAQANAAAKAKESYLRMKAEDPERWAGLMEIRRKCLRWDDPTREYNFKKGCDHRKLLGERKFMEARRKTARKLAEMRSRDRAREAIGLEPLTRLRTGRPSKERTRLYQRKWHLTRKYGYVDGGGLTVYYTPETRRTPMEHLYGRRQGIRFLPLPEGTERRERVAARSDWSDRQGGFNTSSY